MSDSSPPSSSRDWYFPSPPFIHSSKFPNCPRRFPGNPRVSRHYPPDSGSSSFRRVVPKPLLRDVLSSSSAPHRTVVNHAGLRRRAGLARRGDQQTRANGEDVVPAKKSEVSGALSGEKVSAPKKPTGFSGRSLGIRVRWKMAIAAAVSVSVSVSYLSTYYTTRMHDVLANYASEAQTFFVFCFLFGGCRF